MDSHSLLLNLFRISVEVISSRIQHKESPLLTRLIIRRLHICLFSQFASDYGIEREREAHQLDVYAGHNCFTQPRAFIIGPQFHLIVCVHRFVPLNVSICD